jgi:sulfur relay protein TusB/DsrH
VLLIEDGVYAATVGTSAEEPCVRQACATLKVYALQPDMDARGVPAKSWTASRWSTTPALLI